MIATIAIALGTIVLMIASIIFFPSVKIRHIKFSPYWVIALGGALVLALVGLVSPQELVTGLFGGTLINPLKILTLFLSFTILSIYLDEIGFFAYVAALAAARAHGSQRTLFLILYALTSILTIFTANDIVILTLTPFIIYFAKNAKMDPLPYLVAEFVAANTWSMLLIIGNPTNIYLATSFGIGFGAYFLTMAIPTIFVGLASYGLMRVMFHRQLSLPIHAGGTVTAPPRGLMTIGLAHLIISTVLIAISGYIGVEMWLVTLGGAASLFLTTLLYQLRKQEKPVVLIGVLRRVPYSLIPFMLGMTTLVIGLDKFEVPRLIATSLGALSPLFSYGFSSFLFANIINNIPMSILFTEVLAAVPLNQGAIYATIIGSNLGAILSPIGALAGIMWMTILKDEGVRYSYGSFLWHGLKLAVPLLVVALLGLSLMF